ncbi:MULTISPECIES: DNA translocase FtsK [Legionella]|uniref:DNA translocase FtsK n=1 Tax=Legionella maceachernii TaxID=466 RepID=A0A0W0W0W5_9GAMM|nr:DNA translocase FtsK [Legionella maceachernii]KTD25951.1 cell division protein FtsK [Legionella maceachernii]SJZ49186.1 DNA segregation ATPase FtsK/SpoIIIE, S-DNA-T family [Legionella maceachernii]SUP03804.1 DNA translocase FtsK [Legionella maceachernii]
MGKQQVGKQAKNSKKNLPPFFIKRISEGSFILIAACALFVLLSLSSYELSDPSWSHVNKANSEVANAGGQVGAYIADTFYFMFGYFAFLLPVCIAYIAWLVLKDHRALKMVNKSAIGLRASGLIFLMIGGCGLLSLEPQIEPLDAYHNAGGVLGSFVSEGFEYALNMQGATLLLFAILLVGITLLTGLSWILAVESLGSYALAFCHWIIRNVIASSRLIRAKIKRNKKPEQPKITHKSEPKLPGIKKENTINPAKEKAVPLLIPTGNTETMTPAVVPVIMPTIAPPAIAPTAPVLKPAKESVKEIRTPKVSSQAVGSLPSLSLLDKGQPGKAMGGYTHQELESLSREVEQHLLDFGIQADVVAVHPGPVITRFELQLAAGIKVSKLSALAKDLARSLSVTSVRVVEVIPGKTVVGLELPNQHRDMVRLSEVLSADVYQQAHSPLTLALGVDIAGHPMVVDLAKMPHLLVAGTTGSGKSVGINAMILSLLFKSTPQEVRLIMVDPKMLELSVYDGIPHLLTPVVTDMKEAASALRWCVGEMERRYRLMASLGVRNLAGFNAKITESAARGEPLLDPLWKPIDSMSEVAPELQPLPYIVVVIDELADMMMVVGKKVEQLIARIAQKARAAGIHLILATQRPSVDVLTGLIKSNIPTRISFQVSSKIDSRTILDQQGAEQLLGHGDMLYLAPGSGAPLRVHGAFVDDKEVHRIADDWRARGEPEYIDEITKIINDGEGSGFGDEGGPDTEEADPLYDQAVEFVIQTRKASISAVQRRLKIGYNRAARLIEEMERTGIVGPLDGGFRDVLVSTVTED